MRLKDLPKDILLCGGTGQNSEYLWYQQLFILPNLIFILLPIVFIRFQHQLKLYYILFISYLVWILVAQNPDNLRHLIPVVFFANILLSPILSQYNKLFLIPIIFFNLSFYLNSNEKTSPLENILNPDYAIGKFQSKQTYYKI